MAPSSTARWTSCVGRWRRESAAAKRALPELLLRCISSPAFSDALRDWLPRSSGRPSSRRRGPSLHGACSELIAASGELFPVSARAANQWRGPRLCVSHFFSISPDVSFGQSGKLVWAEVPQPPSHLHGLIAASVKSSSQGSGNFSPRQKVPQGCLLSQLLRSWDSHRLCDGPVRRCREDRERS